MIRSGPAALRALLLTSVQLLDKALPWPRMLLDDLIILKHCVDKLSSLPSPYVDPDPWLDLMSSFPWEWAKIVDLYFDPEDDSTSVRVQLALKGNASHSHSYDVAAHAGVKTNCLPRRWATLRWESCFEMDASIVCELVFSVRSLSPSAVFVSEVS